MVKLGRASKPLDLMSYSPEDEQPSIFWIAENDHQGMLTIFNWTEKPRSHSIEFSSLGFPASKQHTITDVFDGKTLTSSNPAAFVVELPSHSARVFKIVKMGIPVPPPSIKVEHLPTAETGVAATFSAQPATSNDIVISYRWNFGDGVALEGREVSHAYTKPGTYQVVVTAIGLGGLSKDESFRMPVSGSVPTRFVAAEKQRYRPSK